MIWLIILTILIVFVILIIIGLQNSNEKSIAIQNYLKEIKDFVVTKQVTGYSEDYLFAVDESNEKIVLITNLSTKEKAFKKEIYSFSDIIGIELIANGKTTVSKKSTTRTIGGAIIGGVIAGGAGAIIGGLSGNTKQTENIDYYLVKILLRSVEKTSLNWIEYFYKAIEIKDIVSVIIDKTDKKHELNREKKQSQSDNFIADELMKLNELKEKGIITEQEFLNQKQKILNI